MQRNTLFPCYLGDSRKTLSKEERKIRNRKKQILVTIMQNLNAVERSKKNLCIEHLFSFNMTPKTCLYLFPFKIRKCAKGKAVLFTLFFSFHGNSKLFLEIHFISQLRAPSSLYIQCLSSLSCMVQEINSRVVPCLKSVQDLFKNKRIFSDSQEKFNPITGFSSKAYENVRG